MVDETYCSADVNYKSGEWTPLIAACINDHLDIMKFLMETCHADVNLPANEGYVSLTMACSNVSMSVSIYLVCEVSDLNVNGKHCPSLCCMV